MGVEETQHSKTPPGSRDLAHLFEPLSSALFNVDESERYRQLASFLSDLAGRAAGFSPRGRQNAAGEKSGTPAKQLQMLAEEKAGVEDRLRTREADLAVATKQLDAERIRAGELQEVIDDQSARLKSAKSEVEQLEAQLVARNAQIHKAEIRCEELELNAQRAELALSDSSRLDGLEDSKRGLIAQTEELQAQMEQLRTDKDAEIARIQEELAAAKSTAGESADALLNELWQRMASAKPPLAEGYIQPNKQAAQRLVDAFVELVRFVDDFDKSMRIFLSRYCHHHPSVKVPWEAYAKGDDLYEFARRTVSAKGGRPVGPLKMRLRLLYAWTYAGMVGCDAAVESIGSELQSHMIGSVGAGSDPNRKIRDYLRDDGHLLFLQHIRELRSLRLAETYGRG